MPSKPGLAGGCRRRVYYWRYRFLRQDRWLGLRDPWICRWTQRWTAGYYIWVSAVECRLILLGECCGVPATIVYWESAVKFRLLVLHLGDCTFDRTFEGYTSRTDSAS